MTRALLQTLLLGSSPFLAWWLWHQISRRSGHWLEEAPRFGLVVAGLVLAVVGLAGLMLTEGDSREGTYVAPYRDATGQIVPGHLRPRDGNP